MKFKRVGAAWYQGDESIQLCKRTVQDYLNTGDKFEMHVSTTRPRGDDYYEVSFSGGVWRLSDYSDGWQSPWPARVDMWLTKNFPDSKRVYVWAME